MRAPPSLPNPNPTQFKDQCTECIRKEYVTKMSQQSGIYYNAGALKLKTAKDVAHKNSIECQRLRNDAKKYYEAAARKFEKTLELKRKNKEIEGAVVPAYRKAAVRARVALKNQKHNKQI